MQGSHPAANKSRNSEVAHLQASIPEARIPEVSIIIPARNEELNIRKCLDSLTTQTGVSFEIIVVDDGSIDRTREIAQEFPAIQVISAGTTPEGWTGKNNAVVAGAKAARAPWLLFTDADTVHLPGSLARALAEAKKEQADLLSYSPAQVVVTFSERAVMPAIFAELAAQYPPRKVREQNSAVVAANGQYILVRRAAYEAVGGHAAVATEILEDVALARLFRSAGHRIYFRYGGDTVCTRMYRSWPQLREGWTKNLARLFPHAGLLAFRGFALWCMAWSSLGMAASGAFHRHWSWGGFAVLWLLVYRRIRAAHFSTLNNLLAIAFGLPMFAYLLLRSKHAYANGQVSWKDRTYTLRPPSRSDQPEAQAKRRIPQVESQA
jgi:glycosyltransferase involved in cell wall biosynthesis